MNRIMHLCPIAAFVGLAFSGTAKAQFFLGAPITSFSTTSGTITMTPVFTANNATYELDISGQLIVTNATPAMQNVSFTVQIGLDPTFNGGAPLPFVLQLSQSGFVDVPAGGQIFGWNIHSTVIGPLGAIQGSVSDTAPGAPFFPGITTYGPTVTFGTPFIYNPGTAVYLELQFDSLFDGLTTPNTYIWDFPITLQFTPIPEPASAGFMAAGALLAVAGWKRWRSRRPV